MLVYICIFFVEMYQDMAPRRDANFGLGIV